MALEYRFHGGCEGCSRQKELGVDRCVECQFFDANWDLPNLNNSLPSKADLKREEIKKRLGLRKKA